MDFVRLLRVEAGRLLREIRYYKFDQVISFFDLLLICLGIFTGMARDLFPGQSIFYAWIGMILWRYASVGLQTACSIVEKEIRLGTLEQLMLTRCSFEHILMARMFVRLLAETVKLGAVSLLIGWFFQIQPDRKVSVSVSLLSILLFLMGVAGMGCMIGGASLLYKKANALVNAVSYFTLFFTGAVVPLQAIPQIFSFPARVMPFYWCVESIRNAGFGRAFWALSSLSCLWLLLGFGLFRAALRRMLEKGSSAQY